MPFSHRGLWAASVSAACLVSAAPCLASDGEAITGDAASNSIEARQINPAADQNAQTGDDIEISAELVAVLAETPVSNLERVVPSQSLVSMPGMRAAEPVDRAIGASLGDTSGLSFSGNVTLASEYRFRGVDLTNGNPAIQGGFDVSHSSGLYAGTWASNLDEGTVGYGSIEVDLYGGWSGPVAEGLTADIGFIAYTYPDAGPGNFDYYEVYGSLAFTLGPVSSTVGVAYDPKQDGLDFGGLTRDNLYLYTDLSVGITNTPITLNAHLGYTDGSLTFTNDSKSFDWVLGADWAINDKFTASLAYVDAEQDVATGQFNPTSSSLVASLSASF